MNTAGDDLWDTGRQHNGERISISLPVRIPPAVRRDKKHLKQMTCDTCTTALFPAFYPAFLKPFGHFQQP